MRKERKSPHPLSWRLAPRSGGPVYGSKLCDKTRARRTFTVSVLNLLKFTRLLHKGLTGDTTETLFSLNPAAEIVIPNGKLHKHRGLWPHTDQWWRFLRKTNCMRCRTQPYYSLCWMGKNSLGIHSFYFIYYANNFFELHTSSSNSNGASLMLFCPAALLVANLSRH